MGRRSRSKTIGQAFLEVRELKERAAVHRMLSNYLRTRYLPRDAIGAQAKVPCEGVPVSEAVLEELATELLDGAQEMEKAAKAYENQELEDV